MTVRTSYLYLRGKIKASVYEGAKVLTISFCTHKGDSQEINIFANSDEEWDHLKDVERALRDVDPPEEEKEMTAEEAEVNARVEQMWEDEK